MKISPNVNVKFLNVKTNPKVTFMIMTLYWDAMIFGPLPLLEGHVDGVV